MDTFHFSPKPGSWWPIVVLCVLCTALIMTLKTSGVVISLVLVLAALIAIAHPTSPSEVESLRTSIRLSAEDISDVLAEYDQFLHSQHTDHIADRQITRPALADPDCCDPDIEEFFFSVDTARRFLTRLDARLAGELTVPQLETLLNVTDRRALDIRESWVTARQTAARLGTDYDDPGRELPPKQ